MTSVEDTSAKPSRLPHQTDEYLAENLGPGVATVCIVLTSISTIFILLRLFTRGKIMAKLHADDWLASLSVLFQWACVAFVILAIRAGNGRHFDTLSIDEREGTIFWTVLALPMGMLAFSIPKLGVAALLTRIMNPTKQHKFAVWGLTSFCALTVVASIILIFAQCTPMRALWDLSVVDKKCIPGSVVVDFLIFSGSVSAFTDLYLALYPATVLFKLQMNIRKKIALSVALGIGSVATVIAIKKCTRLPALAEKDFTYKTSDLVLWVVGEGTTIIVASCIPLLQPLVDLIFGRRALNSSENNGYSRFPVSRLGWKKRDTELGLGTGKRGERHKGTSVDDLVEVGSQDTILRTLDYVKLADHHHDGKPGQDMSPANRILRTDVVTITYDNKSENGEGDGTMGIKDPEASGNGNSWPKTEAVAL
ncbi:unnamed protein product [Clonostachys rhizophaga]|uniref:Rhodopsin domain-containing protein n=1 Tax=Clonostachys rhizophaga TaxID=160324 RepID=A0A9N9YF92_9HYPO|nr:unnamed protein product [Clonostachys rhizophaga]